MSLDPASSQTPAAAAAASVVRPAPGDADFEAIHAAVMATERGRWFLHEYARRNRQTDTAAVLAAIDRLIAAARADAELKALAVPAREPPDINPAGASDVERLRAELADMANAIALTKAEIASIKPDGANADAHHGDRILEATEQLDSVVRTTERATSDILAAAEQVQEVAWTMREQGMESQFCDQLDSYATAIYTACSFQDLTGQRTRKIIHVLRYLEARILAMSGLSEQAPAAPQAVTDQPAGSDDLVQNDVDRMIAPPPAEPAPVVPVLVEPVLVEPVPVEGPEPAESMEAQEAKETMPPVAEPAGVAHALEGPKGSFSLAPEVATEPQQPVDIPAPVAQDSQAKLQVGPEPEPEAKLQAEPEPEPEAKLQMEPEAEPKAEPQATLEAPPHVVALEPALQAPVTEPEPRPEAVIADLRAFASDMAAEFSQDAASPADTEPPALPVPAAPPIEPPPVALDTAADGENVLPLAAAPQLADLVQYPAPQPAAAAATPGRANDIAEDLFADVMALTAEERIALFT
jgi:hypothetical protein